MKTILVTGGTGYIGSHVCVQLLEAGYQVVIADNLINSKRDVVDRIARITGKTPDFYQTDLLDLDGMRAIFRAHHIDGVIHFAGLKAVGESVAQPLRYYTNNVSGTLNLLTAMQEAGCPVIVFSSSATVYGETNPVPFDESMPTSATNPYGYTKVAQERILADIAAAQPEMSVLLLRYFNPVGAHPSGLIGENPNGIPNNLMPFVAKVATGDLPRINVFGDDYDTPDGTGVRDYIHVCDLAHGHVLALEYAFGRTGTDVINLGTGHGSSVLELIHAFSEACGHELPYVIAPRRPGDIAECWADTKKAKEVLGFTAEATLADMCRDSWNFICRQREEAE